MYIIRIRFSYNNHYCISIVLRASYRAVFWEEYHFVVEIRGGGCLKFLPYDFDLFVTLASLANQMIFDTRTRCLYSYNAILYNPFYALG